MTTRDQEIVSIDDLGESWGRILGQVLVRVVGLEKALAAVRAENATLRARIEALQAEVERAGTDEIVRQAREVIQQK